MGSARTGPSKPATPPKDSVESSTESRVKLRPRILAGPHSKQLTTRTSINALHDNRRQGDDPNSSSDELNMNKNCEIDAKKLSQIFSSRDHP